VQSPAPILVTGSSGLVGRAVLRQLAGAGHPALGLDVVAGPPVAGTEFAAVDVTDFAAVAAAMSRPPRAVIHLAAMIGFRTEADPHRATLVNVIGTSNVLEAAAGSGVRRLVFASSIMRQAGRGLRGVESDHPSPRNLYGAHKLAGEMEAELYRKRGLEPVVVAISATLGTRLEGSSHERSPHCSMLELAAPGMEAALPAAPGWSVPLRRSAGVAAILVGAALAESPRAFYHTGGRYTSMGELAAELETQVGCRFTFTGSGWPSLPRVTGLDAERDFGVEAEDLTTMVSRALADRG
jgi:nucleoside-diphosphate-sugar epimerase